MFFVLRFLAHWLLVFITIFSLMGCYAIQVWKGDKRVDITALQPGVTRANAEAILGSPVRSWTSPTSIRYATYEYYAGTPPNRWSDLGFLDIGKWRHRDCVALGLVPASWDGMTWDRKVLSCDDRVVLGIFDEFDELPLDGRSGQHKWGPDSTVSEK
jgi:hypothetical protein